MFDIRNYFGSSLSFIMFCGWILIVVIWFSLSYYDSTNCIMFLSHIEMILLIKYIHILNCIITTLNGASISNYTAWIVSALHCSIQNLVLTTVKFTTYDYPFRAWSPHTFFDYLADKSTTICRSRLIYTSFIYCASCSNMTLPQHHIAIVANFFPSNQ